MVRDVDRSSIDEILQTARPSSVAEALGLAVVRRGANFRCLCPFHDDSDPSLVLYDNWDTRPPHHHCFVCGADGDVFDMVRQIRNGSFGDAAEWLRGAFGLAQNKRIRRSVGRATWDGSKQAAFDFASALYLKNNNADQFSAWLRSRNLPSEIATKARLSYAFGQTLTNAVSPLNADVGQARIETAMLEEIGLIRRVKSALKPDQLFSSAQPRLRDFFFDARIIFPIHSLEGKVIGFAGRAANEVKKDVPKYLYSPGFAKGAVLYRAEAALALLKERERKEIFICEGLVDALRLESLGYPAVSILGAQASKEQIEQLRRIAAESAPAGNLIVHIFLDRDKAGLKGSSKLAIVLAEEGFDADFIWPTKTRLAELGVADGNDKDPDSLIAALDKSWNEEFIRESSHPTALPVVALKIGNQHSLDDILLNEYWKNISLGVRYRAAIGFTRSESEAKFLLNVGQQFGQAYEYDWYVDIKALRNLNATAPNVLKEVYGEEFIADEASRMNVARVLAKSGADRGELPTDEAAWRRLEAGATAFNVGLRERLQEPTFEPLEPFDAVFVARDFEKQNPRLKAMPCPEDLVLQQYMLSETLTERFDVLDAADRYSHSIPAVRFYRGKGETLTTAEDGNAGVTAQTLSFAYQVDMDVLEGRSNASNQGMFRPYIECWRDFISSLRKTANGFEEVYALRLDLKRYYDRLYQSVVKSSLQSPLNEAIDRLIRTERIDEFAPSFNRNRHNLGDAVVDWFCEQSFGFQYYHPDTGRITKSEEQIGIPQGPILSAWLATVALFPLDSELRKVLKKLNLENGITRAGYARYVDDIFLIADSPQILEELRTAVEDACTRLRLEAIPKGELAPRMSAEEFNALLTEGKALVGSGPTPEIGLLSLGDGEAGFETWSDPVQRASALVLLSDRRLYEEDVDNIKSQVFTALNAHDLRPAEIAKASRWIWYAAAKLEPSTTQDVWAAYWTMWIEVTERLAPKMKVDVCPWLDPSLYALDGLEQLLRSAYVYDRNLSLAAETSRKTIIGALSKLVILPGFFTEFVAPQLEAPADAGKGIQQLRRMFVQRAVCVRWIARQMQRGSAISALSDELHLQLGLTSNELSASLVRAWLTDADGATSQLEISANVGNRLDYSSPLRPLFLWLHEAIVLLGRQWGDQQDPLENIRGKLTSPLVAQTGADNSQFFRLLNLWKPELPEHELVMLELRLDALAALVAVCHVDGLIHCLKRRLHLLGDLGVPLPALPGIPLSHLVLKNPDGIDETHLNSISQIFIKNQLPAEIDYRVARREICEAVAADWTELPVLIEKTGLAGRKSTWESVAKKIRTIQPTKVALFSHKELHWAANCFEGLARINYDLGKEVDGSGKVETMEFVPAWPYISTSDWAEDNPTAEPTFSLFGPVVPRTHLAKFAFARDGKGRLRAHEVPLADARLWRIGYAVTDALGMIDELERFQALEQQGQSLNINTAQYVLSRLLGRLRGEGQPAAPGLPHPERPHLTGSTNRAVLLLRSFPTTGSCAEEVQFLLSVEAETVAMRLQSDGYNDCTQSGVLAAMLGKLAPAVFSRLNARQLDALPELAQTESVYGPERRVVVAWRLLDKRLGLLESILPGDVPPASKYAWSALRRSVRIAALSAWVRALVFEMHLAGDASPAQEVEVPIEWEIDDPVLVVENECVNIGTLFRDALTPKGRLASTAKITPLGWLTLFNSQLNLFGASDAKPMIPAQNTESLRASMTELAQQLGRACPDSELDEDMWPFNAHSCMETIFDENSLESALTLLTNIQNILGYRVRNCKSHTWGLSPQAKWFTDESGRQWPLSRGLIDQVGRDRHVEIDEADADKRVWTQTTTRDGKLIGVSVLGETFARTAGLQGVGSVFPLVPPAAVPKLVDTSELNAGRGLDDAMETHSPTEGQAPKIDSPEDALTAEDDTDKSESHKEETQSASETNNGGKGEDISIASASPEDPPEESLKKFRNLQEQEWRERRREKNPGHVRFAIFQFRVDDSYYHPVVDAGFPRAIDEVLCNQIDIDSVCSTALASMADARKKQEAAPSSFSFAQQVKASLCKDGLENQWERSELVPSWNEHRRRRLIEAAIKSCHDFDVDVLVLPEYSVRPDTVEWLRDRLTTLPEAKLSVVAGTYRLHGTPRDLHFMQQFDKIFGEADEQRVFDPNGKSMEKSAFITLLQPLPDVQGAVGVFSRRKKFHSMAMNEFINPSGEDWAPLASLEGYVSAVEKARKSVGATPLDVRQVVSIAKNIRPVDRMAELICSELFASTHPVNHETIRSEYKSLRQRFGYRTTGEPVLSDIQKLTSALKLDDRVDRRSILIVPACTTRSADYWIYGQSGLLAAGLTTVFCAAVLGSVKAGLSGGGSCIIAKSSWSATREEPGHLLSATPYSGWSRGIYYNRPEDALTKKEQAIVIADIDPIYMNEGKPRPQALPVPVQLVAHLPVVEMVDLQKLKGAYSSQNGGFPSMKSSSVETLKKATGIMALKDVAGSFAKINNHFNEVTSATLVDPNRTLIGHEKLIDEAAKMASFFSEPSGWTARLECWNRNWRAMPFFGYPPTLIDWLPVDLSPTDNKLPSILIPPWGQTSEF